MVTLLGENSIYKCVHVMCALGIVRGKNRPESSSSDADVVERLMLAAKRKQEKLDAARLAQDEAVEVPLHTRIVHFCCIFLFW